MSHKARKRPGRPRKMSEKARKCQECPIKPENRRDVQEGQKMTGMSRKARKRSGRPRKTQHSQTPREGPEKPSLPPACVSSHSLGQRPPVRPVSAEDSFRGSPGQSSCLSEVFRLRRNAVG
ncbi:hypothetical protein Taro_033089 [Colocasia esculenta]|uniref:Uncharacterized protein n=1 Tax=Colocasia esculenta TaxID=4460 RepID=A0A843VZ54_COLES|nr:hypothetical protein [Colocasia esculenta]